MWSSFHNHIHYCDGKGTVNDYLEACRKANVNQIGFSSHAPLPFPCKWCMRPESVSQYLAEIDAAKQAFPDIEIYKGMEVDYIPGVISSADFAGRLDYTVGSIHFVSSFEGKRWEIDNTREVFNEGLSKVFNNDVRAAVSAYFEITREMMRKSPPDILGHMDKIKINTVDIFHSEDEPWYMEQVDRTLKAVSETSTIVEVNTRGLYKKRSQSSYPSPWILERIHALKIPVTINSDAHHPDELTREFDSTLGLLSDIGFKNVSVLTRGRWQSIPLNEYGPRQ